MWRTIHLELELELHRQPIAGVLSSQNVRIRPFDGWLELASAVEDARNSGAPAVPDPSQKRIQTSAEAP